MNHIPELHVIKKPTITQQIINLELHITKNKPCSVQSLDLNSSNCKLVYSKSRMFSFLKHNFDSF